MLWLSGDRYGPVAARVRDFQVITPNQAVVPLGVTEEFEGEGGHSTFLVRWLAEIAGFGSYS